MINILFYNIYNFKQFYIMILNIFCDDLYCIRLENILCYVQKIYKIKKLIY